MITSVNRRKRLVMYVVDTKTLAVDNMCWSTFDHLHYVRLDTSVSSMHLSINVIVMKKTIKVGKIYAYLQFTVAVLSQSILFAKLIGGYVWWFVLLMLVFLLVSVHACVVHVSRSLYLFEIRPCTSMKNCMHFKEPEIKI